MQDQVEATWANKGLEKVTNLGDSGPSSIVTQKQKNQTKPYTNSKY